MRLQFGIAAAPACNSGTTLKSPRPANVGALQRARAARSAREESSRREESARTSARKSSATSSSTDLLAAPGMERRASKRLQGRVAATPYARDPTSTGLTPLIKDATLSFDE